MKLKLLLASLLLFALPALALDPHDAQVANVTAVNNVSVSLAQVFTIATLTTHAVNSGTNSYLIYATVRYDTANDGAVSLRLANAGTAIAGTTIGIGGRGDITLITEVENIAASAAIKVPQATLVINGQAGATQ